MMNAEVLKEKMLKDQGDLNHRGSCFVIVVLIAVIVAGILLMAWVPPVSRDALNHHLAVPKLYLEKGHIFELPDRVFSYYPMNLDLLYLVPLYLGNDILAKYIHFFFALMTALVLFRFLKSRVGSSYGLFGVLLYLSTPVVIKLSTTVYVDLGLAFFSTIALLSLLKWRERNFKPRYLILASISCGLALGTKYHGLIVFFILTNLLLLLFSRGAEPGRNNLSQVFKACMLFICIALILFSPWMIRNVLWKQNPLYPLFDGAFKAVLHNQADRAPKSTATSPPESQAARKHKQPKISHFYYRAVVFNETGLEIGLIPLRIFFQGEDGKPQYFDGALNPLLFLLPLCALAGIRRDPESRRVEKTALLLFAGAYIIIIFISVSMRVRYVLPAVPPLVILSVYGLRDLIHRTAGMYSKTRQKVSLGIIGLLVAGCLMQNYLYLGGLFKKIQPLAYISGRIDRDAYIKLHRPALSAHRYAGQHLARDARILGLFMGYRSYYSDRELVFGSSLFEQAVKQSTDAGQIFQSLRSQGITHLLIRYDLFEKWIGDNFNETEIERGQYFFKYFAPQLFTESGYGLHALVPEG